VYRGAGGSSRGELWRENVKRLKDFGSSHALQGCGFVTTRPFPGCVHRTTRGYRLPSLRDAIASESRPIGGCGEAAS